MRRKIFIACLCALLLGVLPVCASANSAEPPCFTVVVSNAPEDLELSLQYEDGSSFTPLYLSGKDTTAWESYYRFFYAQHSEDMNLRSARLLVETGKESFLCPLPEELGHTYNGLITLDLQAKVLKKGVSPLRTPLLVFLRVALTLLIEGLVFLLLGYREKRSWLVFLLVNLVTQCGLNLFLSGGFSAISGYSSFVYFCYLLGEILVFVTELIVYLLALKEHQKWRGALAALAANSISLILGGFLLERLPL